MKVIGITGGIGSGKSTVARLLEKYFDAYLIITDDIAKFTMEKGQEGYVKIVSYFGEEILDDNKEINRSKLSKIVFSDEEKRKKLNSFTHPQVHRYVLECLKELKSNAPSTLVVIETALFIEAGYEALCDEIWFVTAPYEIRKMRVMKTRNMTEEAFESIVQKQASEEEFQKICTHCILNIEDEQILLNKIKQLLV